MIEPAQKRSVPRTAAEWFALRLQPRDAALEQLFSQWIAESPRNAEEYTLCELTWGLAPAAAEGLEVPVVARRWYRNRVAVAFGAVACLAFVALAVLRWMPPTATRWSTAPGEQRIVALEDGSRVTINTRTMLEVRMGRSTREVRMSSGEAFFEVAKDPSRPFVVSTGLGTARAIGTRFDVMVENDSVEVATEEGKVWVQTPGSADSGVVAAAGSRATLVRGASQPALGRADLRRIENWRARRLEFDRVPLEVALKEFSRYTDIPILAATPEVAQTYVSAVWKVGDIEALRATLNGAFGLRLVRGSHQLLVMPPENQ